jgi:hypothetical protein
VRVLGVFQLISPASLVLRFPNSRSCLPWLLAFFSRSACLIWSCTSASPDSRRALLLLIACRDLSGLELWPVHGATMKVSGGLRHVPLHPHHAISYTNTTTFFDNADLIQAT